MIRSYVQAEGDLLDSPSVVCLLYKVLAHWPSINTAVPLIRF
jgi:hypothetical protein